MSAPFFLFKGACTRGIYDNMKTAVETIFVGKERKFNRRFAQMCRHHLVEPVACTPASGWEKGQVENQVGLARERFFTPRLRFKTYDDMNAWLLDKCGGYAKAHPHPGNREQDDLGGIRGRAPEARPAPRTGQRIHEVTASVSKTCLVRFDNNKYSVNASAVGAPVEIHAYADRIVSGKRAGRRRTCSRLRARRDDFQPMALRAGSRAQARRSEEWRAVQGLGVAGSDRTRAAQAGWQRRRRSADGEDSGRRARRRVDRRGGRLRRSLSQGVHSADVILNILARRREPPPPPAISIPEALTLLHMPLADCARYDQLRRTA